VHHRIMLRAAALAALVLLAGVATANANRAFTASPEAIAETSRSFTFRDVASGLEVICEVTLAKSFHAGAMPKARGVLYGFVTEARAAGCRSSLGLAAQARFLLMWHITYESFSGALPRITAVLVIVQEAQVLLRIGGTECLYRGDVPFVKTGTTGVAELSATRLRTLRNLSPLFRALRQELIPCPSAIEWVGEFTIAPALRLKLA
jgi:hypothetical protein